jgi:GH25 family lysozyme M1 (1,4-beta-N-acetylmuramidase)
MIFRIAWVALAVMIAAGPACAVNQNGMDVSVYQKKIDWKVVQAAGIKFAFTKATEGNKLVDIRFKENMAGAASVGIPIGPYHFARPDNDRDNLEDAANEANHFVDTIESYYSGASLIMRPVIDVEKLPGFDKPAKNKAFLSQWIHKFAATVNKRLGFNPIIYANSNYARNYFEKDVAQYDLWLANWTLDSEKPPAKSQYGMVLLAVHESRSRRGNRGPRRPRRILGINAGPGQFRSELSSGRLRRQWPRRRP